MHIQLESITKTFGKRNALDGLSVDFPSEQLTSILGPSGCGKSTLLNILAGILPADGGRVLFDGVDVTQLPPEKRGLGFVFQSYALYPHLTVSENIAFPLQFVDGMKRPERSARIAELAELVRVTELLDRRPAELSGGQQQRVAIARALAKNPSLLLMDEPLSNLDARLRSEMRTEIRRIQSTTGITMILVTHDQEDALAVSDSILVMNAGAVQQHAGPTEIYGNPASVFVADFIGNPPASQLDVIIGGDGAVTIAATGVRLPLTAPADLTPGEARLAIRAESVHLHPDGEAEGTVRTRTSSGREWLYEIDLGGGHTLRALAASDLALDLGAVVRFRLDSSQAYYFDSATGTRRA